VLRGPTHLLRKRSRQTVGRPAGIAIVLLAISGCSPQALLVNRLADTLAAQGSSAEEDLELARDAAPLFLKLSESLLARTPAHLALAESVARGFTQYAYAFVAFEADRVESADARAALRLRQRAARLYARANRHAMAALESRRPGLRDALAADAPLQLEPDEVGLAYWAAASWGASIALSKDRPDVVADLPLALRLAQAAYRRQPDHALGDLASLMGTLEASRPGGSVVQARAYFDHALAAGAGRNAGVYVSAAEALAQPLGDRPRFEMLLRQALRTADVQGDLGAQVMRERATWLLATVDERF
jgi:hypothetical protein